ncbi:MAG: phosphoserine transaminase [Actinomycetota bacterium]|nr:phosphoserine transaminase [Actinomycetota bacterium]
MSDHADITIPPELRPSDGRFGSGPSKVRSEAIASLYRAAGGYLGTSHRHAGVRSMVRRVKDSLNALFALPEGYEVVLGIGGTTVFWDAASFGLIERKSQHLAFGEFSWKFAEVTTSAPHLEDPEIISSPPGTHPAPHGAEGIDVYALTHNETSTGVAMPIRRVSPDGLTVVDATSAAGAFRVDPGEFDVYYFAPQKVLASDGGLWLALCSPGALERIEKLSASSRHIPASLGLWPAVENSRKDQTYNTPGLASLFLMSEQLTWMLENGGLEWAVARCATSAGILYGWAEASALATPFVADPAQRSPVVGTIDFADSVDAAAIASILRANGIVDTEPYRKLGRNQLRIAMYPAIEPEDVKLLTRCIDHVLHALGH